MHAYYYNEVVEGNRHPYDEYYEYNKKDPNKATEMALRWWSELDAPPSEEDQNCHVRAPTIRRNLSKDNISNIGIKQFKEIFLANHSTIDHARRMPARDLNLEEGVDISYIDRVNAFAELLWEKKNQLGENIVQLLRYILDGGPAEKLPGRLFEVSTSEDRKISHLGMNQLAEIAGWARPEVCPPRNGRTSKALRALGYNVRVY